MMDEVKKELMAHAYSWHQVGIALSESFGWVREYATRYSAVVDHHIQFLKFLFMNFFLNAIKKK